MSSRLIRIQYGFLSQSLDPYNVSLPWKVGTRDGMFKMNYTPEGGMYDNLKFWANTNKGEYVMDPKFGLDVRRYLFDPAEVLIDNVIQNAREQLPIYFSELKPVNIEVLTSEEIPEISENTIIFKLSAVYKTDKTRRIALEESIG